jgi:anthraniloyl-CoA monooxygenase
MKIVSVGGGPAGLYFAISMKLRDPAHQVRVIERNRPDDTFGWGVVFSDQTMDNLAANDGESARRILDNFAHWDDIDVHFKGKVVTSGGHGFCGIGRKTLLEILQRRARDLGVELVFETEVEDLAPFAEADLIVAADGVNSRVRELHAEAFQPDIDLRRNRFIWLGTDRVFDAFAFIFEDTDHGWVWAHAYRFDRDSSTFIVECAEETWRGLGLDRADQGESIAICERLFADTLDGRKLMSNARHLRGSAWLNFPRVTCAKWHHGKVVLMGDAAHTAHFSIGSGTKLALEDAIGLADALQLHEDRGEALESYQEARRLEVLKLQSAARNSTEWFENVPRYAGFEPLQFAYSLLTRSQRVSHENLRLRDRDWVEGVERWFAARATGRPNQAPLRPMFAPFKLRGMELTNRVVVSPMSMYSAEDGTPGDFHLVHYGARAQGGAGLIYSEMTNVARDGRITPGCAGLYKEEHLAAWKRIVDFVHGHSGAKVAIQLGHAGPKGSTRLGWDGMDEPLEAGNWPLLAPSPVAWSPRNQTPRAMDRADMDRVKEAFVAATGMAEACGFDMVELHAAQESVEIAKAFKAAGADIIDVSAGQTSELAKPIYGRMFQTPFSDRIRNEAGIATMAVGNIYEIDHVNGIIAAGRADLCCLGRPHLADPYWTLRAAAEQDHAEMPWPKQYLAGKDQLARNLKRAAEMARLV